LQENLSQDNVVVILEDGRKDDGDAIRFRLNEHGFVVPVMDGGSLMTFLFSLLFMDEK